MPNDAKQMIGLPMTLALVVGSIIEAGIFNRLLKKGLAVAPWGDSLS